MVKTIVTIEGMACAHCEAKVADALRDAFGTKKVKASHKKGIAEIISEEKIENTDIKSVIEACGFTFISAE